MKRRDYHHGDLRRALLEAAGRLVAREGVQGVSLRAIAREAGVSPAAPYHHFDDRESLLAHVAASGFEGLRAAMEEGAAVSTADDPLRRLQAAGIAYVGFAVENPELYRLMFSGLLADRSRFPGLQEAADGAFGALEGLLLSAGRSGGGRALPAVAVAAWSTVHGLAFLLLEGIIQRRSGGMGSEEIARQVTLVLGRGLRSYAPDGGG